jgi:extracellular elastinolytic metalloproteinase
MHDILYRYGFTEKSFNFQANNFNLGGVEGDKIQLSVQDPSGFNNAIFSTGAE